jgi:Na+-transporting NADH:ubiquinone oxidoreductase subunit NqrC
MTRSPHLAAPTGLLQLTPLLTPLLLVGGGLVAGPAFATEYLTQEQAQTVLFPQATRFQAQDVNLSTAQMQQVGQLAGVAARSVHWHVLAAYAGEKLQGYIVFDEVIGKFELISYAVALNLDASVKQVEILNYRESHGFEVRNPAWRKQFVGKRAESGLTVGAGIANISGATLSCTHLTDGVRRIAALGQVALKP